MRNLRGHGLEEGVSTRLLIYAAQMIAKGISPIEAAEVAICSPITDDRELAAKHQGNRDDDYLDGVLTIHAEYMRKPARKQGRNIQSFVMDAETNQEGTSILASDEERERVADLIERERLGEISFTERSAAYFTISNSNSLL